MWTNFFRSRYVRFLEQELASVRKQHAEETERIKTVHAAELERAITECNRGWAEADRLRLFLVPGLPAANRVTQSSDDTPNKEPIEPATPWLRLQAKIIAEDEKRYQIEEAKRKAAVFPTPKLQAAPPVIPEQENEDAIRQ